MARHEEVHHILGKGTLTLKDREVSLHLEMVHPLEMDHPTGISMIIGVDLYLMEMDLMVAMKDHLEMSLPEDQSLISEIILNILMVDIQEEKMDQILEMALDLKWGLVIPQVHG